MTLERGTSSRRVSRGANMLGAPLAGVLIAVVGQRTCSCSTRRRRGVGVADVVFVPASAPRRSESEAEGYFAQLREGYRFLSHTPLVRAIVILVLVTNTLDAGMGGVLMPVYAEREIVSVVALGLMAGAMGITAFADTLVFDWTHRAPRLSTLVIGSRSAAPSALRSRDAGNRARGIGSRSRGSGSGRSTRSSERLGYERVPPELRARVFGALSAGVMASAPIGALLAAACIELGGLQATLIGFSVIYLVCTLSPLIVPAWRDVARRPVPA